MCYVVRMHIKVRVNTNARKETVLLVDDTHLTISVKEKPLDNAANQRVIQLVALQYRVPANKVHIVRGHRTASKILTVE